MLFLLEISDRGHGDRVCRFRAWGPGSILEKRFIRALARMLRRMHELHFHIALHK